MRCRILRTDWSYRLIIIHEKSTDTTYRELNALKKTPQNKGTSSLGQSHPCSEGVGELLGGSLLARLLWGQERNQIS